MRVIDFATKVRLIRDLLGWRQYRMAEELGVTPQTISDWEMGIREPRGLAKRMLEILAEREGLRFNERGYPEYAGDKYAGYMEPDHGD